MPTVTLERPYCTLAELQAETRNKDSDKEDWFKQCINSASRMCERLTKRDFWYHDHTSTALKVKPSWIVVDRIALPWPIISLTEVKENDVVLDTELGEDYFYEDGSKVLFRASGLWYKLKYKTTVELKGTFGYALTTDTEPPPTMPPDVRRACVLIAASWTMQNRREIVGYDGSKMTILESRVPDEARELLKRGSQFVL